MTATVRPMESSSVVAAMRYNAQTRVVTLIFRGDRGLYRYYDVPPEMWEAFQAAPSKGTFLNQVFKEQGYQFEKVEPRS